MIKSISYDQDEILNSIVKLYVPDGIEADCTFGNGSFYKNISSPKYKWDIEPLSTQVTKCCSTLLPVDNSSLSSLVFDPPFLTYIKKGRVGNGNMVMAKRFGGYWSYKQLQDHYQESISEAYRVLKPKGVYIFKCQDIIHNHQMHCTHGMVINMAESEGFRLKDLFVLCAKNRMNIGGGRKQQHARIHHSYFLVFQKGNVYAKTTYAT